MDTGTQPIDLNVLQEERSQDVDAFLRVPAAMLSMLLLILVVSQLLTRAVPTKLFLLCRLFLLKKYGGYTEVSPQPGGHGEICSHIAGQHSQPLPAGVNIVGRRVSQSENEESLRAWQLQYPGMAVYGKPWTHIHYIGLDQ